VVAAVVGREYAEQKFTTHTGVGGVGGRPFQIGGFHGGGLIGIPLTGLG
jgi:hypothetical protein